MQWASKIDGEILSLHSQISWQWRMQKAMLWGSLFAVTKQSNSASLRTGEAQERACFSPNHDPEIARINGWSLSVKRRTDIAQRSHGRGSGCRIIDSHRSMGSAKMTVTGSMIPVDLSSTQPDRKCVTLLQE